MLRAILVLAALHAVGAVLFRAAPRLTTGWWADGSMPEGSQVVDIRIALRRQQLDQLPKVVMEVSDPTSSKYGEYLTTQQVNAMTAPDTTCMAGVTRWLKEAGLPYEVTATGDQIVLKLTVDQANRLFQTQFHGVHNMATEQRTIRAGDIHLPDKVAEHVETIFGVHGLPLPPRPRAPPATPYPVTPDVINKQYKISGVTASGSSTNRQAVAEFQGQYANQSDVTDFFKKYLPNAKAGEDQIYKYVGTHKTGEGVEALLDVEFIMGVAPGVKTEFWEYPGMDFCGDLKMWTTALLASDDIPKVTSVSYGWQGNLTQIGCHSADSASVDADFAKLAAKGITIIFASGDSGSGLASGCPIEVNQQYTGDVISNGTAHSFTDCCNMCEKTKDCASWSWSISGGQSHSCALYKAGATLQKMNEFISGTPATDTLYPSWPASSPWVTAVGSTRFVTNQPGEEMATDQFGSGGGFSTMFPEPSWGTSAVASYFNVEPADKLPPKGSYPPGGRATPDVAALGEGFQVIVNGRVEPVGGTSASAPTFAAVISLLNEHQISAGKKPLGYLNPWIYQNAAAFMDVTVGSNRFGRGPFPLQYGWDCVKGYDPVTGFGTPDFTKMMAALP